MNLRLFFGIVLTVAIIGGLGAALDYRADNANLPAAVLGAGALIAAAIHLNLGKP